MTSQQNDSRDANYSFEWILLREREHVRPNRRIKPKNAVSRMKKELSEEKKRNRIQSHGPRMQSGFLLLLLLPWPLLSAVLDPVVVVIDALVFIRIAFFFLLRTTNLSTFIPSNCFAGFVWYLSEVVVVVTFFFSSTGIIWFLFFIFFSRHRSAQIIKRPEKNVNCERNRKIKFKKREHKKTHEGWTTFRFGQLIFVCF